MNRALGQGLDTPSATPPKGDIQKSQLPTLARLVGLHLAPFLLLALGIIAALEGWSLPYIGASRDQYTGHLLWVDPAGPAAQAGLQVGDLLLSIDGIPIAQHSPLWGAKSAGDPLTVGFLRGGGRHSAQVILAAPPPGEQALRLSLYLMAFSFWLTATVVLFLRPRRPEAGRFWLTAMAGAAELTLLPLFFAQVDGAMRLSGVIVAWNTALLIDLHSTFPLRLSRRAWLLRGSYTLSALLAGVYLVWDPSARMTSTWGPWLSRAALLYFLVAVLISLALLARAYRRAPTATVRRRVRLVLTGTALALMPPCLFLFTPMLLGQPSLAPDALALLSLVLIPLAYAYGIYRYNLMGIDFLINRMVVYVTLGLLLLVVYFAVALVILALTGAAGLLAGALASLVAVVLVVPLRQGVDLAWERVFYPDVYGYRGVVDQVSRRLAQALDYDHLGRLLVHDLSDAMDLEGAALLLVQDQDLVLQEATGTLRSVGRLGAGLLSADEALVRHLTQAGTPVATEALAIADSKLQSAIHLWVPLVLTGELQGVLLLGAKRTDEFFSPRDRQLLKTLAGQAALAVKNVRLLAELHARMDELARDRRALQAAYRHLTHLREDERHRLAAELHDDVIQPLTALSLDIGRCARVASGDANHEPLAEGLMHLTQQVAELVKVIRRICVGLRPPVLDWGLVPALRSHLRAFADETNLEVELVHHDMPRLPEGVQISLFRVVQEALNNVRRHARARTVYVRLTATSEVLELSVTDDGAGFEPDTMTAHRDDHFGLRLMREYVEALGGRFQVDARPGQGTSVTAWVPRPADDGQQPPRANPLSVVPGKNLVVPEDGFSPQGGTS